MNVSDAKASPKGRRAAAVALSAGSGLQRPRQQGSKHHLSPAIPSNVFLRYISLIWGKPGCCCCRDRLIVLAAAALARQTLQVASLLAEMLI
jgi:hypothetical protein